MKENKMIELLNREWLSLDDLITLATVDYTDYSNDTVDRMIKTLDRVLQSNGALEISEYNPDYPNNPYMSGYELDGVDFWMSYNGICGRYWGNTIAQSVRDCRNRNYYNFTTAQKEIETSDDYVMTDIKVVSLDE